MLHKISFAIVLAIASSADAADMPPYGKLTVTEDLIRREVLWLGGDWESGTKPELVSFLGEKFQSRHFEMLTHLRALEYFHAEGGNLDNYALVCLSRLPQLERLDIAECQLEPECLPLLRGNRELQEIYFESMHFTDPMIAGLAQLKNVKKLVFIDCQGMTKERLSTLKIALPLVQINH